MLGRLLVEAIRINWHPQPDQAWVKMDPTQIDQILIDLCINSRDAIANGGEITIETESIKITDRATARAIPGDYVRLAISDNGAGIDKETRDRIFEPFFTAKALGKGTGLGLATVYGIVKQNEGFLNVYSEQGKGTTFKIYIPEYRELGIVVRQDDPPPAIDEAGEMILVVEDDPGILKMCERMLSSMGYLVLLVESASDALKLAENNNNILKLLISDVILPDLNGRELSSKMQQLCPGLKTLYMSGYMVNVIAHRDILDDGINFIQKPFSKQTLGEKVRKCLGRAAIL